MGSPRSGGSVIFPVNNQFDGYFSEIWHNILPFYCIVAFSS